MAEVARTIYLVQKFIPMRCPKCGRSFSMEGVDYSSCLGEFYATLTYDIILCKSCNNLTMRVMLESWQVDEHSRAEVLALEHSASLQVVTRVTRDTHDLEYHIVHLALPNRCLVETTAQMDTPSCLECGIIMVAVGSYWKCLNCATRLGPDDGPPGLYF